MSEQIPHHVLVGFFHGGAPSPPVAGPLAARAVAARCKPPLRTAQAFPEAMAGVLGGLRGRRVRLNERKNESLLAAYSSSAPALLPPPSGSASSSGVPCLWAGRG